MPAQALNDCPRCNYNLRGLPAHHRCPECGLEYDEHTRIWRPAKPWPAYTALIGVGSGVLINAGQSLRAILLGQPVGLWRVAFLAGCVLSFGYVAWKIAAAHRRGFVIALCPCGIFVRNAFESAEIPWLIVVRLNQSSQQVSLIRSRGAPIDLSLFLRTPHDVDAFRRALDEAKTRVAVGPETPAAATS